MQAMEQVAPPPQATPRSVATGLPTANKDSEEIGKACRRTSSIPLLWQELQPPTRAASVQSVAPIRRPTGGAGGSPPAAWWSRHTARSLSRSI